MRTNYLNLFRQLATVVLIAVTSGLVVGCSDDDTDPVSDEPSPKDSYKEIAKSTPLTFEALEDGAQVVFAIHTKVNAAVQYSTDSITWRDYTPVTPITLDKAGDKVMFRGNNETFSKYEGNVNMGNSNFICTKDCYLYGNVMSLLDSLNYPNAVKLTGEHTFLGLFMKNTHLLNHPSIPIVLPATTLTPWCYSGLFFGCTKLTTAPELPATTLEKSCYYNMFGDCTNLSEPPVLPATTLAEKCYERMFQVCSNLSYAPDLPATKLTLGCYDAMFTGCTKLIYAPLLPAAKLEEESYSGMFFGCRNLKHITCLATDISAERSTQYWLSSVASNGTFIKAAYMKKWQTNSSSGIPSGWEVKDYVER